MHELTSMASARAQGCRFGDFADEVFVFNALTVKAFMYLTLHVCVFNVALPAFNNT